MTGDAGRGDPRMARIGRIRHSFHSSDSWTSAQRPMTARCGVGVPPACSSPLELAFADKPAQASNFSKGLVAGENADNLTIPMLGLPAGQCGLEFRQFLFDAFDPGFELSVCLRHGFVFRGSRAKITRAAIISAATVRLPQFVVYFLPCQPPHFLLAAAAAKVPSRPGGLGRRLRFRGGFGRHGRMDP